MLFQSCQDLEKYPYRQCLSKIRLQILSSLILIYILQKRSCSRSLEPKASQSPSAENNRQITNFVKQPVTICKDKEMTGLNSFPIKQVLDSSKLKELADDNFTFDENGRMFSKWVENTVGKGEIARYEQFLLFSFFLKGIVLQTHKNQGLLGKGLTVGESQTYSSLISLLLLVLLW